MHSLSLIGGTRLGEAGTGHGSGGGEQERERDSLHLVGGVLCRARLNAVRTKEDDDWISRLGGG
jgi:hypothetical protein